MLSNTAVTIINADTVTIAGEFASTTTTITNAQTVTSTATWTATSLNITATHVDIQATLTSLNDVIIAAHDMDLHGVLEAPQFVLNTTETMDLDGKLTAGNTLNVTGAREVNMKSNITAPNIFLKASKAVFSPSCYISSSTLNASVTSTTSISGNLHVTSQLSVKSSAITLDTNFYGAYVLLHAVNTLTISNNIFLFGSYVELICSSTTLPVSSVISTDGSIIVPGTGTVAPNGSYCGGAGKSFFYLSV